MWKKDEARLGANYKSAAYRKRKAERFDSVKQGCPHTAVSLVWFFFLVLNTVHSAAIFIKRRAKYDNRRYI
jgi:hypothetical protein